LQTCRKLKTGAELCNRYKIYMFWANHRIFSRERGYFFKPNSEASDPNLKGEVGRFDSDLGGKSSALNLTKLGNIRICLICGIWRNLIIPQMKINYQMNSVLKVCFPVTPWPTYILSKPCLIEWRDCIQTIQVLL
jgi:hypothetical protein